MENIWSYIAPWPRFGYMFWALISVVWSLWTVATCTAAVWCTVRHFLVHGEALPGGWVLGRLYPVTYAMNSGGNHGCNIQMFARTSVHIISLLELRMGEQGPTGKITNHRQSPTSGSRGTHRHVWLAFHAVCMTPLFFMLLTYFTYREITET